MKDLTLSATEGSDLAEILHMGGSLPQDIYIPLWIEYYLKYFFFHICKRLCEKQHKTKITQPHRWQIAFSQMMCILCKPTQWL